MALISQPGSDHQIVSISLDAGYTRNLILILINVHAVLDHHYLDGTQPQITSPAEDYPRESASPYAEIAALCLDDIDWRAGEIVVRGKGRTEERLPLPCDVAEAIAGYCAPAALGGRSGRCSCAALCAWRVMAHSSGSDAPRP